LLQLYPYIKVGGGNFKTFLLAGLGSAVGIGAVAGIAAAVAGEIGGLVAALAAGVFAIVVVVYFARIAMGTAERRGLSKWLGLLTFVPLANILIYPYMAFHDGFRAPNKVGLLIGLLLAFGPLPGQIALVAQMSEQAQQVAQTDLGDGQTLEQALGGLGVAMEIGVQLAMLDGMDPSNPNQAAMMRDSIAELRMKLDSNRAVIGAEAAGEMDAMLSRQEQRLADPGAPVDRAPMIAQVQTPASMSTRTPTAIPGATRQAMPAALPSPPLTAGIARNGNAGFAIPMTPNCSPGTALRGAAPPEGTREWCEKIGADAGIKHGWMTEYHEGGARAVAGEYRDGLRVGIWSRFYDDGTKRAQAEFEDGLQHGVLLSWNPDGSLAYEKHFSQGAPASR
jgi:hypothetical protein